MPRTAGSRAGLALAAALALAPHADAAVARGKLQRLIPTAPGSHLLVRNINGDVVVQSWDRPAVLVEAQIEARGRDAAADLKQVQIGISRQNRTLRVETREPSRANGIWAWLSGKATQFTVTYRITVPRQMDADVRTVNGEVRATNMTGRLEVASTNGEVRVVNSSGSVEAQSTNGAIEVELRRAAPGSPMAFVTTNGAIRLYLPADLRASVEATTTNGTVRTDLPLRRQGVIEPSSFTGTLNGGGSPITLSTTNGEILIARCR